MPMNHGAVNHPIRSTPVCVSAERTKREPAAFTLTYCKTCLTPDTRPNGQFNADGVCTACEYYGQAGRVNFDARFAELKAIIDHKVRNHRRKRWQCIVGVSGGKDSTRQALWVREKLGVNPLLVSVAYPPRQISPVGAGNLSNLIDLGFDTLVIGPAPRLSRELVRAAFFRFANWCRPTEMCLFAGVPQIAIEKGIKLILWGENPALQVGDLGSLGDSIWDGRNLVNINTLAGGDLGWFREVAGSDRHLSPYKFPTPEARARAGVETVFLGPAWRDWSDRVNSAVSYTHGFRGRTEGPEETADLFSTSMVDEDWMTVNMLLKYYKLGFSRGTEHANAFIRSGQLRREEAIAHVERYDGVCAPRFIDSFCRYIGITETVFWETVRKFAHPQLFDVSGPRPVKRFKVGEGLVA